MAYESYPFEDQETTEAQYTRLFRELQDSGVAGAYGDSTLKVGGAGTSMGVIISPGLALVRGAVFRNTSNLALTVNNSGTVSRTDLVVLQLNPATNAITAVVKPGDALTGAAPTLTQSDTDIYELPLASVVVAAGAVSISSANVNDTRSFLPGRVGDWRTGTRPGGQRFRFGYNRDSGRFEYNTGSSWSPLVNPNITPVGAVMPFAGTTVPAGWVKCNGASLSRTTYADLFAAIGTTYGSADNNHFNVPNLTGRFVRGVESIPGDVGGAATHDHTLDDGYALVVVSGNAIGYRGHSASSWNQTERVTGSTSSPNNNMTGGASLGGRTDNTSSLPPYLNLLHIIKATVL